MEKRISYDLKMLIFILNVMCELQLHLVDNHSIKTESDVLLLTFTSQVQF